MSEYLIRQLAHVHISTGRQCSPSYRLLKQCKTVVSMVDSSVTPSRLQSLSQRLGSLSGGKQDTPHRPTLDSLLRRHPTAGATRFLVHVLIGYAGRRLLPPTALCHHELTQCAHMRYRQWRGALQGVALHELPGGDGLSAGVVRRTEAW